MEDRRACSECGALLVLERHRPVAAGDDRFGLEVGRLPVLECPKGHRRWTAVEFEDFTGDIHRALRETTADIRGFLLWKSHHCRGCEEHLDTGGIRESPAGSVAVTTAVGGHEGVRVVMRGPAVRCAFCGRRHVLLSRTEILRQGALLTEALEEAGISLTGFAGGGPAEMEDPGPTPGEA